MTYEHTASATACRHRTPRRLLGAAILSAALLGQAGTAEARSPTYYQGVAEEFLAGIGIPPGGLSFGTIDIRERETRIFSETALVWIRLPQCPGDWLVMRIHEAGLVEYTYMRDGCPVPGINQ